MIEEMSVHSSEEKTLTGWTAVLGSNRKFLD